MQSLIKIGPLVSDRDGEHTDICTFNYYNDILYFFILGKDEMTSYCFYVLFLFFLNLDQMTAIDSFLALLCSSSKHGYF